MQQELRLLGRLDGGMTRRGLCEVAGLCPQHVSDYFNTDDNPTRRDLPTHFIAAFESACGNTLVSQWIAKASHLTILEEMQADRLAA